MLFTLHKTAVGSHEPDEARYITHGDVQTPAFMPVGTYGTAGAMLLETLKKLGQTLSLEIPSSLATPWYGNHRQNRIA